MLQLRPTFSESWYRVQNLKVRLRPTAQISRQYYRGERWYVVRDPAGNQFHRLSDNAYRFIGLLDGTRTVEEAWDLVGGQLADDAPTQPEVIQILSQLYSANLVETNVTPDATVLLRRHKAFMKRRLQNRLMNILFPRIPLWDPDQFICRWMPVVRPLLSKFGAILWLIVVGAAMATVLPKWEALKHGAENAIAPSNWLWLWFTFVFIKLIHELGHAFGCRRFGGEVHELGIMFLVMIPTPYVDASTAWAFPSRWARMFVGAAGMIVELFFASLCAFIWVNTSSTTLLNQLSYNAMLIASVSTIVFNANPLLRYDGYYILSDFLEIPNLRQKAMDYTFGLIKRHVFNVKAQQPLPPIGQRFWLFFYSIASGIYRIFVGIAIIVLVAFRVPVLGILMSVGGIATWLLVPVFKTAKYLMIEPELHRKRTRATIFTAAVAAAAVVLIGFIPFWFNVRADGMVEPENREVLTTTVAGFVDKIAANDGDTVEKDQVILAMRDPQLDADLARAKAELRGLKLERQQAHVEDQNQKEVVEYKIIAKAKELANLQRKHDELTIRSPFHGRLISPRLDELNGRYIPRGEQIATVATVDKLVVRASITQDDAEVLFKEDPQKTEVRFTGDVVGRFNKGEPLKAGRIELIGAAQDKVPSAALTHAGGGEIAVNPRDPNGVKPQVDQFEVRIHLENPNEVYLPGQVAHVKINLSNKPLLWQWMRRFWQIIQTNSTNNKWM